MDVGGTWKVRGRLRLKRRARYSGSVTLTGGRRNDRVRLAATCRTRGGVDIVWDGTGRLIGSRLFVKLRMRIGSGGWRSGEGAYVVTTDGAQMQGTWGLCGVRIFGGETLQRPGLRPRPRATTGLKPPKRMPGNFVPVPLVPQAVDYSCGAACLAAVLYYWRDFDLGEGFLYRALHTTVRNGTEPKRIAEVARRHKLRARYSKWTTPEQLWAALSDGDTVILDLQAWHDGRGRIDWKAEWDDGHYVVLVGKSRHHVFVMDPSTCGSYAWFPLTELEPRWHETERGERDHVGHDDPRFFQAICIHGRGPLRSVPGSLLRMH